MYRTAPQIVFQLVGGFCITQYTYPILFDSYKHPQPTPSAAAGSSASSASNVIPSLDAVSGMWGKIKRSANLLNSSAKNTLSEDVEIVMRSHRVLSTVVLSCVVVSGGGPALIGAALSVYYDGSPEGVARYARLKAMWRDVNKS